MTIQKRKNIESQIRKILIEMIKLIGVIFLFAFSMLGAIVFYTYKGTTNIFETIIVSSVIIVMLFIMIQVKEKNEK